MMDPIEQVAPNDNLQAARRLYDAFGTHDASALRAALTQDFRCVVAEGMPNGWGGTYDGAETTLRECWARVFALIDVRPIHAPCELRRATRSRPPPRWRAAGPGRLADGSNLLS